MNAFPFKPSLWPTVAACLGIVLTLMLGNWQLNRAAEKQRLEDRLDRLAKDPPVRLSASAMEPAELVFRRVEVEGEFDPVHTIYLDNKIYRGVVGYDVVAPLRIGDSDKYVLVDRGWVPWTGDRSKLPPVMTPAGPVHLVGLAVIPPQKVFELSSQTVQGKVWENLVLERFRKATSLDVAPIVLLQESRSGDGLVRDWPRPDTGIATNKGYAFQWFAMSFTILVIYVVVNVKRARKQTQPD